MFLIIPSHAEDGRRSEDVHGEDFYARLIGCSAAAEGETLMRLNDKDFEALWDALGIEHSRTREDGIQEWIQGEMTAAELSERLEKAQFSWRESFHVPDLVEVVRAAHRRRCRVQWV